MKASGKNAVGLQLVEPTLRLRHGVLEAHREWGPGRHEDGFGIGAADDLSSDAGVVQWVERIRDRAEPAGRHEARSICRWIVEGDQVLGGIALRLGDDPSIDRLGNIGYGIRPSARGRGVATWALAAMIEVAAKEGLSRVLLVCEKDNRASIRTIEANGGRREVAPDGLLVRYWVETSVLLD